VKQKSLAIWKILTLSCEESAQLMSESLDQKLPWSKRMAFRLHAIGCRSCRRFFRQIRLLRSAAETFQGVPVDAPESPAQKTSSLSPEARQRIEQALQKAEDQEN
jgi:hypothetical protein